MTGIGSSTALHPPRPKRNQGTALAPPDPWNDDQHISHWLQHIQNYQRLKTNRFPLYSFKNNNKADSNDVEIMEECSD